MPLIRITLNPDYKIHALSANAWYDEEYTAEVVKDKFAHALPDLFVLHALALSLDPNDPPQGVQVTRSDYDRGDVNIANVWVQVQFSEDRPHEEKRYLIRNHLYSILTAWFREQDLQLENFVLDVFWGPTNGMGSVGGVEIMW